jgi:hypothetical protein
VRCVGGEAGERTCGSGRAGRSGSGGETNLMLSEDGVKRGEGEGKEIVSGGVHPKTETGN